jgi:hypothetical protein
MGHTGLSGLPVYSEKDLSGIEDRGQARLPLRYFSHKKHIYTDIGLFIARLLHTIRPRKKSKHNNDQIGSRGVKWRLSGSSIQATQVLPNRNKVIVVSTTFLSNMTKEERKNMMDFGRIILSAPLPGIEQPTAAGRAYRAIYTTQSFSNEIQLPEYHDHSGQGNMQYMDPERLVIYARRTF